MTIMKRKISKNEWIRVAKTDFFNRHSLSNILIYFYDTVFSTKKHYFKKKLDYFNKILDLFNKILYPFKKILYPFKKILYPFKKIMNKSSIFFQL